MTCAIAGLRGCLPGRRVNWHTTGHRGGSSRVTERARSIGSAQAAGRSADIGGDLRLEPTPSEVTGLFVVEPDRVAQTGLAGDAPAQREPVDEVQASTAFGIGRLLA